jgi:5-methyltetrahydrofolate--homocysteine methyltransferase
VVGESARSLFADAQAMLDRIIAEHWLTAARHRRPVALPREGDDVLVLAGNDWTRLPFLRQQVKKREGRPNMCLADFIDPDGEDWIGGFAVGIHGLEPHLARFKAENDDYSDILLKALPTAWPKLRRVLHAHVRNSVWGYADEHLTNQDLIRESYQGIRPAPGYPACPDHSLKPILFDMLGGGSPAGVTLTESFAMLPTSAVSGFYFGHRDSQYFGVARIGRDQLEDYAARRGVERRAGGALAAAEPGLSALIMIAAEGVWHPSKLSVTGNDVSVAPGVDRKTSFVADATGDAIRIENNRIGPQITRYERR